MQNALVMLAKYPDPGLAKTRLGRQIGYLPAAMIYERILRDQIDEHMDGKYDFYIAFAPKEFEADFRELLGEHNFIPSEKTSLNNIVRLIGEHYGKLVMITSDVPGLERGHIEEAFSMLDESDVIIGPNCRGGLYLSGIRDPTRTIRALSAKADYLKFSMMPQMITVTTEEDLASPFIIPYSLN